MTRAAMRYLRCASLVGRPTGGLAVRSGGGGLSGWWCARSTSLLPSRAPSAAAAAAIDARVGRGIFVSFSTNRDARDPLPSRKTDDQKETAPLKGTPDKEEQELAELPPPEAQSWRQRAKTFALEYGRVGIATHVVLSAVSFSTIYVAVSSGVDVTALLHSVGVNPSTSDTATNSAGSFLIAYTIYKVLSPVRWPITFAVTPIVLRALRRRGYMLAPTAAPRSPPPPPPSPPSVK